MKLYSTWPVPDTAKKILESNGHQIMENQSGDLVTRNQLLEIDTNITGLMTLLTDVIDGEIIKSFPELKVIANVAVGFNNIDVDFATSKRIYVCNTPDILTDATADLSVALVLSVVRQIVAADKFTREGHFTGWRPDLFLGDGFAEKNFGIYGMGKIGRAVAKRMRGFGCNILYHNRYRLDAAIENELNATYVDFETLLEKSDYLTVLSPLTPETEGRFGKNEFTKMKKGAYFFNIARGKVMDEAALLESLKQGHLRGAGLDVYENEPLITDELLKMSNVVLLPHIGSAERETREQMFILSARNMVNVLSGKPPLTPVNSID